MRRSLRVSLMFQKIVRDRGRFCRARLRRTSHCRVASFVRHGLLGRGPVRATAREWVERLQVKCSDVDQPVQSLSGGNQQKVVLAKWLLTSRAC